MNKKDKNYHGKSETKDYRNKLDNNIFFTGNNTENDEESLKEKLNTKTKELEKANEKLSFLVSKQEQCEKKISLFIHEKNELSDKIHQYELMELDLKLQNSDDLKEKFQKAEHRINITKKLLDGSKEEIIILKNIIKDYDNLGFFDFIRNKKPDSVKLYKDRFDKTIDDKS